MNRRLIAAALACLASPIVPAASALAQAAAPFPVVQVQPEPRPRRHLWAYLTMATGALMVGGSFLLAERGDDSYEEYLRATDPRRIEDLYDRTVLYDRVAQGTLLGGEALVATGLYLRFLRRADPPAVSLDLRMDRCALALRF